MRGLIRVLAALTDPDLADGIVGDLIEGWQARRVRSRRAAGIWFVGSVIAIAVCLLFDRLRITVHSIPRGAPAVIKWLSDIRHAGRGLVRRPSVTASTVVVLGLGVGLCTAVFALADPYLLRPLPYAAPSELVAIEVGSEGLTPNADLPSLEQWRARDDLFAGIAVANAGRAIERLRLSDRSALLISQAVSRNLFEVLGVPDPAGSSWRAAAGAERPMVFLPAARGRIPGDVLEGGGVVSTMDGDVVRVSGTLRESFVLPFAPAQELLALTPAATERIIVVRSWNDDGTPQRVTASPLVARLAPGVTPAAAQEALAQGLPSGRRLAVTVTPLHDRLSEPAQSLALGVVIAGMLVLLVCAGNVANLLLANSAWRAKDIATRRALGASRLDVWRLSCTEASLLVALGTALAFGIAVATLFVAGRLIPLEYRSLGAPTFTGRVAVFGVLVALVVGVLGILPALLRSAGAQVDRGRSALAGGGRGWTLRSSFVALQTCLATILIIGAMLLGQSYLNLEGQRIGFDRDVIAITAVYPTGPNAPSTDVYAESADRLSGLPGVTGVAVFFGNAVIGDLAEVVGRLTPFSVAEIEVGSRRLEVTTRTVSPAFFEVAGLSMVQGRALQPDDAARRGVVINERLASQLGGEEGILGRTLRLRGSMATVVGVVEDAFERRFTDRPTPTVYDAFGVDQAGALTYLMRTGSGPSTYAASARRALFDVEPDVIVVEMNTLGDKLANTVRDRTFATLVLTLFAVAGVGVTAMGLIGIVAATVARRTRDIAIRVALGARRSHVRRLVAFDVLVSASVGTGAGLLTGRWLSTGLESLVYGVEVGNWSTATASAVAMLLLSTFTAVAQAQRAVGMSPTEALRID